MRISHCVNVRSTSRTVKSAAASMEWLQKGWQLSLVVFTKKSQNYFRNFGVLLRETSRQKKNSSFEKRCVLDSECRILSQESSDSCILYFNAVFYGKYAEEYINRQLVTCECCDDWNSWSFEDPVLHHPKWTQCDLLKAINLSLSLTRYNR